MTKTKRLLLALGIILGLHAASPTEVLGKAAPRMPLPWDNGNLMVSANGRFLLFENSQPFFWLGDTGWLLPERLNRDEAGYYLKHCHEAGFNVVQVQVLNDVPSFNIYGKMSNPSGWDLSKADPDGTYSYWDHLDYIIDAAANYGIYIGMVAIWGSQIKNGHINEAQAKTYGQFLANRYKDKPNIVWIMGGDIEGDIHPEVWNALATTIKAIDHNHLMTYHPRGRYTSARWWSKAPWIDFHMFQSGHRRYGQRMGNAFYPIPDSTEEDNWMYVDSTWSHKPIKPVIDGEPSYENIPIGLHDPSEGRWKAADVRRYAYWSVFAGSCGHTYGHNSIMQMLRPGIATGYGTDGAEKPWYVAMEDSGYNEMKYLKALMLAMPYFTRIPDQSIVIGNGLRYDRLSATRGNDYLMVYSYRSDRMKIDLRKITGKKKNLWWMDAATGTLTFMGTVDNGVHDIRLPKNASEQPGDGVLIAIDATKEYISKQQTTILTTKPWVAPRNLNE